MKLLISLIFALFACLTPACASTGTATLGQTVTVGVTCQGTAPFTYQWFKDGAAISGATSGSLVLTNAKLADAGRYTVRVSNEWGSTLSDEAVLTVAGLPPSNVKTTITLVVALRSAELPPTS